MFFKNDGFTLIEILLSIVLIAIISAAVFPVFSNVFGSLFSAGDKTKETYFAQQEIIRSMENIGASSSYVTTNSNITINLKDPDNNETTITSEAVQFSAETYFKRFGEDIPIEINYYKYSTP
ncbi:prepilin-type N-terminal cleavage/methylation domain-containing protein [Halanaerobium saccharolyticum]|uniref:Prepilin-type N-terminal cleavage/methylation domain-containing protein n=1 Tax=Halanaerobium saccharolyticum TaxID=43595 RepID=A0A4R6SAM1_9FIRM|nr:type II secretion system protein [Halanaerobium saccharolyticum]TDP96962.1 prepilin-type N-terminal cleavage/methylation domain-containing protein [Halanaerobium saccharolyticum]